jgi:hypothetical protein
MATEPQVTRLEEDQRLRILYSCSLVLQHFFIVRDYRRMVWTEMGA